MGVAALLFVVRMGRSVVRRLYRCTGVRSRKRRTVPEIALLEQNGAAILAAELQGALFFGSGERLAGQIADEVRKQETRFVVLDLRRVSELDSTGAQILFDIHAELEQQGRHLLLAVAQSSEPAAQLAESGVIDAIGKERVFPDLDRALQWAEDHLLRADAGEAPEAQELPSPRPTSPRDSPALNWRRSRSTSSAACTSPAAKCSTRARPGTRCS